MAEAPWPTEQPMGGGGGVGGRSRRQPPSGLLRRPVGPALAGLRRLPTGTRLRHAAASAAPRTTPRTEPMAKFSPPALAVIRYKIARPSGTVKVNPFNRHGVERGTVQRRCCDKRPLQWPDQQPPDQPMVARLLRRSGWRIATQISPKPIGTANSKGGRSVSRARSMGKALGGTVVSTSGNKATRSGDRGPASVMNPAIAMMMTIRNDRRSPPPSRISAPKPQFPAQGHAISEQQTPPINYAALTAR